MSENIPRFQVDVVPDCHPEIGRWLGILDDARKRLQYALRSVQESDLDAPPAIGINTIGTILYHIAMADLNWIYDNLLQQPYPADILPLFPYPITDEQGNLSPMRGWNLQAYQQRLSVARAKVHEVFKPMTVEAFRGALRREEPDWVYEMTPESVLQHLAQHESEHRGEIQLFVTALRSQK
ncbi:MAG: DinB family protein [bacterium]|nr:DinB family protein [bacterium]